MWPLLALGFSFCGAVIIGYNQHFKIDGRVMAVWRVVGVVPVALAAAWLLPWPRDPQFYAVSVLLGFGSVVGDVLLMNAAARYGGRLSALYVPMKMLLGFALWSAVAPDSLAPLLAAPWKLAAVLACFGAATWALTHIRRNDMSWSALLAVLPVAGIFAVEDVVEKLWLPAPVAGVPMAETLGAAVAMLVVMTGVGALPALVWLRGRVPFDRRTVLASAAFGVILVAGIAVLLLALAAAPNPGYVAAVSALSTVWLGIWGRVMHGERNNTPSLLLLVAAAMGVVAVVAL